MILAGILLLQEEERIRAIRGSPRRGRQNQLPAHKWHAVFLHLPRPCAREKVRAPVISLQVHKHGKQAIYNNRLLTDIGRLFAVVDCLFAVICRDRLRTIIDQDCTARDHVAVLIDPII